MTAPWQRLTDLVPTCLVLAAAPSRLLSPALASGRLSGRSSTRIARARVLPLQGWIRMRQPVRSTTAGQSAGLRAERVEFELLVCRRLSASQSLVLFDQGCCGVWPVRPRVVPVRMSEHTTRQEMGDSCFVLVVLSLSPVLRDSLSIRNSFPVTGPTMRRLSPCRFPRNFCCSSHQSARTSPQCPRQVRSCWLFRLFLRRLRNG